MGPLREGLLFRSGLRPNMVAGFWLVIVLFEMGNKRFKENHLPSCDIEHIVDLK